MTILGEQTWFPSGDRVLEGWVHRPDDGRAVGAVVIAGPFAHEALVTYRSLRMLAVRAAERGFVAVRFSWSGTGDSEAAPDSDLAGAWQQDFAAAVELARAASGIQSVDAVGIRFGGSVVAAADVPLRTRVLWDPLGGRAFLRMQSSLLTMHLPVGFPRADSGTELCGYTLNEEAVSSLRTLPSPRPDADGWDRSRVLLQDDPDTSAELFDREPNDARVPLASVERALDLLGTSPHFALPAWDPTSELISLDPTSGTRIRQTFVRIGPENLPGIFSEPVDTVGSGTAALFVPFGNDPKGVDRIPRATSVRLAGQGTPTLRADRRGIGDAADPRDVAEGRTLTEAGFTDVATFATWLTDRTGDPVVGIGLCSGGWLIARAATVVPFERLIMVNNQAWSTTRRFYERQRRVLGPLTRPANDPDADGQTTDPLLKRIRRGIRAHAPYLIRSRVFSPLGKDEVVEMLLRPVPEQTSIRLLFGSADLRHWESSRGPRILHRLRRRGRSVDVEHDERADHALMSEAAFQAYLQLLDREFGTRSQQVSADATTA
jgi:hypothetical protein